MRQRVVAIAKQNGSLNAVELKKDGQTIEILWAKTEQINCEQWRYPDDSEININSDRPTVVAFDSSAAAFYRFKVPAVRPEELDNMIALQAEARFPLPAEEIELAWRADGPVDGQFDVTVAVARKDILGNFATTVKAIKPTKIILDCQAVVTAWQKLFTPAAGDAVVISIGSQSCQVCLVNKNVLVNMACLDTGLEDFSGNQHPAECFIQDITSVLAMFDAVGLPIFLLSNGDDQIEKIVSLLKSNGLEARVSLPVINNSKVSSHLTAEQIYQYRVVIGAGLIGLEKDANWLNIFQNVYQPAGQKNKKPWYQSLKVTSAVAAAMFVLMIIAFFAVDMTCAKLWENSEEADQCSQLVGRQRLIETTARRRINILELLNKINKTENKGIELYDFSFKQGQAINIRGQAPNAEQLKEFEKSLQTQNGISDVKTQNPKADEKSGKVSFSMTFHYKGFTKKQGIGILEKL
jgi:hypothetical protein